MDRYLVIGLIILLFLPVVSSLDPDEKVYFDQLNTKTIQQLSSKIDVQSQQIENDMKREFSVAKEELKDDIKKEVKSQLISVAIGLAGIVIITLGIFKVVDLRISHTRNIKKYEDELKKNLEEVHKQLFELQKQREIIESGKHEVPLYKGQSPSPAKKKFSWRLLLVIILVIAIISVVIGVVIYLR